MLLLTHAHHEKALENTVVSCMELFPNIFPFGKTRMGLIKQRNVHLSRGVVTHGVNLRGVTSVGFQTKSGRYLSTQLFL